MEEAKLTLEKVLRKAIKKEVASWLLYNDLSRRVNQEEIPLRLPHQQENHP